MTNIDIHIEMHRGDLEEFTFTVEDESGEAVQGISEIFFSVKRAYSDKECVFQKRMSTGGIVLQEDGYHLTIQPADTDNLGFCTYPFDIEVTGAGLHKTFLGELELLPEVTHAANEGE